MKKMTKYLVILIGILVVIFLMTKVFSFAKYASNAVFDYYLESKGLYFTSDKLDVNPVTNVDKSFDGSPIKITLKNSLNNQKVTSYDINYKASCSVEDDMKDKVGCRFTDSNKKEFTGVLSSGEACINNTSDGEDVSDFSKAECEEKGYTYTNKLSTKDLFLEVYSLGDEDFSDVSVNVTVESTEPYKKVMSGVFNLHKNTNVKKEVELNYKDNDTNGALVVTNTSSNDKCLTLKWDSSKLRLDSTDLELVSMGKDSNNYINEVSFTLRKENSVKFMFYKTSFKEKFDVSMFSLEEGSC